MSVGGIGGYHVGQTQSTRWSNTLGNIGSAAFDVTMGAATVAAGTFGGPAAAAAVSTFRSGDSGSGTTDDVGNITNSITNKGKDTISQAGAESVEGQDRQIQYMRLQMAVNEMSQVNTLVGNMQKARHDAMMATIQNTR